MNDFDYENMQKKRIAKSALHRKCGSKSKKCSLPSDYLTAKQRKELNGMETTYRMNAPVAWNVFKMWPNDIQREYLKGLCERYHVGAARIAQMFNIANSTMHAYVDSRNLKDCVPPRGRMTDLEVARWNDFMKLDARTAETTETDVARTCSVVQNGEEITLDISEQLVRPVGEDLTEEAPMEPERKQRNPSPTDFEMSFAVGTDGADTEAVLEMMKSLLGKEAKGMLTIRFQRARKKRSDKKVQGFCAPDAETEA